jgi:hypothetical protein
MLKATIEVADKALDIGLEKLRQEIIMRTTSEKHVTTAGACRWYKISQQAYYQGLKRHLKREAENESIVTPVRAIRQRHPRMGGRKLHHKMQAQMAALKIQRGRDAFLIFYARKTFWYRTSAVSIAQLMRVGVVIRI